MEILIVIGSLFVCFALGVPIAYALGLGALAGAYWIGIPLEAVMLQVSSGVSKFAMLTIPFLVLAGAIMAEGGMARRLVAFANVLVGMVRVRGGLSAVNVLATTFLSGISGSAVADTSAIGSVMIPQMEKTGYPRVFATNVTISASVQALLVPPSQQCGDLLARHRRHDLDNQPVYGRSAAGSTARRLIGRAVSRPCLSQRPPARRNRGIA
jgi:TRAP-type mannitol/chloroaromatic compound transport system permease large subunit